MKNKVILYTSSFLLLLFACTEKRYKVDTSSVNKPIHFAWLYKDILPQDGQVSPEQVLSTIQTRYPTLARGYLEDILQLGHPDTPFTRVNLAGFLADPYIKETRTAIYETFPDTKDPEKEYTEALKRYSVLTPEAVVPSVVFSYNGFNYAVVALDTCMLVGLEMYLGQNFSGYKGLSWPDYISIRRRKELMVPESLTGWLMTEFPKDNKSATFIDDVVYRGKILFYLQQLLPGRAEHELLGYTPEGYAYAVKNEGNIYGFFIQKQLFYSEDKREIIKYTEEAPFSAGMPHETPGRIAWFLGWRIVSSYMDNHKDITIDQLMRNHDYKSIFTQSKYKPKK